LDGIGIDPVCHQQKALVTKHWERGVAVAVEGQAVAPALGEGVAPPYGVRDIAGPA
jgi:hypothetical protein